MVMAFIYRVGHKKCGTLLLSKILSLTHSVDNLQQCDYYVSHHTVNMSSHYHVKCKCQNKLVIISNI